MKYVIMTNPNGFQLNPDGTAAEYQTVEEAEKHMSPGDVLIPIYDTDNVIDFQTGKKRLPIYNRSGIRDRQV